MSENTNETNVSGELTPEVELQMEVEAEPSIEMTMEVEADPEIEMEMQVEIGSRASELNAEAWAVGQRRGVDVPSTDQTYHNNAKYYAEQAAAIVAGDIVDDTAGIGDLLKVWSADKDVKELDKKAPVIEETISTESAIMEIADAAANLPVELAIGIDPVQDLHGQESPWHGGDGKNLISNDMFENGGIASAGGNTSSDTEIRQKTYFPVTPGTTFSVSCLNTGNTYFYVYFYNGTTMDSRTNETPFTVPENVDGIRIKFGFGENPRPAIADLVIQLEVGSSVTSWVPYENICPIAGWTGGKVTRTGKNLLGGTALRDALLTAIPSASHDATNKVVHFTASSASAKKIVSREYKEGYAVRLPFKENTQYSFVSTGYNANTTTGTTNINIYYTDGTSDNPWFNSTAAEKSTRVFVSGAGKTIAYIKGTYNKGTSYFYYEECGIFEGVLTAADFEPYNGNTYNIAFPAGAGTVYGGELTVNKDGSGSLVVDRVAYAFGSADTFTKVGSGSGQRFSWYKNTLPKPITGTSYYLCTHFKNATVTSSTTSFGIYCYYSSGNNFPSVTIRTKELVDGTMDAAGFNQWIADQETAGNPVVLVYTMATPGDPIALTPGQVKSLLGYNALWADTGNIKSVEFCADTKLYIDKKFTELQALILEN